MEELELRKPLIDLISKIKKNALETKKEVDRAKNVWPKEITTFQEEKDILQTILDLRGSS